MDEDEEINDDVERAGAILSPEGIVMLPMAIFLDLIGLVLTIISILTLFGVLALEIPEIVNWISDGLGFAFFGLWAVFRTPFHQEETDSAELAEEVVQKRMAAKKALKGTEKRIEEGALKGRKGLRFGVAFLGELIPFVGAFPFWTWFVYSELKR